MAVYLVSDGEYVKIGTSVDPRRRVKTLQTASPRPLRLLATLTGGEDLEQALHAKFEHVRVRGEWFQLSEADLRSAQSYAESYYKSGTQPVVLRQEMPVVVSSPAFADDATYRVGGAYSDREHAGLSEACDRGEVRLFLLLGTLQRIREQERRVSYLDDALVELHKRFDTSARHLVVNPADVLEELDKVWYSGPACSEVVRRSLRRLCDSQVLEVEVHHVPDGNRRGDPGCREDGVRGGAQLGTDATETGGGKERRDPLYR